VNAKLCKERFKEKNTVDPCHLLLLPAQILRSDLRRKTMFKSLLAISEFPPCLEDAKLVLTISFSFLKCYSNGTALSTA
jgi:hypothetical protein